MVVLVVALGAGVLSGVMLELRDESIHDERQLRASCRSRSWRSFRR
jgi:hypothetical protein